MKVSYITSEEAFTIKISGDVDHHETKALRDEIDRKINASAPKSTILDMSDVAFCDSSGLGLIMGRYKTVKSKGGELSVKKPSDSVEKMIRLSGLDKLVPIIE